MCKMKVNNVQWALNGKQIPLCARHCEELYASKVLMTDIDLNVVKKWQVLGEGSRVIGDYRAQSPFYFPI